MSTELATLEQPGETPVETRHCTACLTHKPASDFGANHKHTCRECVRRKGRESSRKAVRDRNVQELVRTISDESADLSSKKAFADGVMKKIAPAEELETLVANNYRALLLEESWRAKSEGLKAIERLQDARDDGRELREGLSKLSEDQKCQLALGLLMRAQDAEGTIDILREFADELGYALIPKDSLEGSASPTATEPEVSHAA